jgi:cytochrome c oxidase assembly protein subunit 15
MITTSLSSQKLNARPIALWLLICCAMIFVMAVIGAITRLTESGLSMTRWHAVSDMLLPADETAWQAQFDIYQQSPEYQKLNAGMELKQFKSIYFWEWLHRLWGRLIGLVYALPMIYFFARRQVPDWLKPRLLVFLALGGLQGFIGWYMVKSGLIDEPRVSHYRLALHLGTAFVIFGLLWRQAIELLYPKLSAPTPLIPYCLKRHSVFAIAVASLTMLWGVFVAGLDAGLIYNEFPLMGGRLIPGEAWDIEPLWRNLVDNHATVQFIHRALAVLTFITVATLAIRCLNTVWPASLRKLGIALFVVITLQVALGIATLLTHVNVHIAATHQAGALTVLALLIWTNWELIRYPKISATISNFV